MDLDRSLGQVQGRGDLAVGPAGGELGEDGPFPVGQLAEQGVLALLPARIGQQGRELVDQPPGRGGSQDRVARGDRADGGEQLGGRGVLEQEPAGARP